MLKVLIYDDGNETTGTLRAAARSAGCEVLAEIDNPFRLPDAVQRFAPDAVLMDVESPGRDVLEQLCVTSRDDPRPIVMFTADGSDTAIEAALSAGVSAYVVDGIDAARINAILQVALTRFRLDQRMRDKLEDTERRLEERKLIDRAKALVMQHEKLDEGAAYTAMRRAAMARGIRMGELAREIIAVAARNA